MNARRNKRHVMLFLVCFLLCAGHTGFAAEKKLLWGGPGFDPTLKKYANGSSLFILRYDYLNPALIDILVDSPKTVGGVGSMTVTTRKGEVSSTQCWKAMRHPTAPWGCSFKPDDLLNMQGKGKIQVFDRSRKLLLGHKVDLEAVKKYIKAGS